MRIGILLLSLPLAACERAGEGAAAGNGAGRRLVSRTVDRSDALGSPADMALVGSHLVLLNPRGDSALRVYDTRTDRLVRSLGREGAGPGEFLGAWSIDPEPGSATAFWVYDIALRRMTRVDLAPGAHPAGARTLPLHEAGPVAHPVWIGDSLLVSVGFFPEGGRLAHVDPSGRLRRVVGNDPPGSDATPMQVRQHAYQGKVQPNADRSLLALATRHADRLEILRVDGTRVAAAERPATFEPVFRTAVRAGESVLDTGDDLRFGYVDIAATPTRIYSLYSGRSRAEAPGRANFGETVFVYDWSGARVDELRLDAPALTIEVDEARGKLYAVQHDPVPAVVVYDLGAVN